MRRRLILFAGLALSSSAIAQAPSLPETPADTRRELIEAQRQANQARIRAERLERSAANAAAAADKSAQQAAALAARIQQAEADIAAQEAQIRLIERQRADLRARLAQKQKPLVELTGALQRLSRRPTVVALLRPGSVRATVHTRALLETLLPEVRRRTAALRADMAHARALQDQARAASARMAGLVRDLAAQRLALGAMAANQRLAARDANGSAEREAERALALAEKARDLGALVGDLEQAATLREKLASLPGPIIRPDSPSATPAPITMEAPLSPTTLAGFVLPVAGRLMTGFGDASHGTPTRGITFQTRAHAQVVSPAAGRVAFADSYTGFGHIVIIDHPGGWTSLVTGLSELSVHVGDALVAGAPLGQTGPGRPVLTLELRKDGVPVNPLDQLGVR